MHQLDEKYGGHFEMIHRLVHRSKQIYETLYLCQKSIIMDTVDMGKFNTNITTFIVLLLYIIVCTDVSKPFPRVSGEIDTIYYLYYNII